MPWAVTAKAVEVAGLCKRFGSRHAVEELSFAVEYGALVGLIGPEGSGKTTVLRCLAGHVRPDGGHALVAGRRYRDLADPAGTLGAALDPGAAHPGRRGRDHLRVLARQARLGPDRVEAAIERVGLGGVAHRRADCYPPGTRWRLALAAALLGDPAVVLLDDPAEDLDAGESGRLRELLRDLADEGRAVLFAGRGLAGPEVDEVVVIGHGRLIARGTREELLAAADLTRTLVTTAEPERLAELLRRDGHEVLARDGERLTVAGGEARAVRSIALEHGIALGRLTTVRPSLETVRPRSAAETEEDG